MHKPPNPSRAEHQPHADPCHREASDTWPEHRPLDLYRLLRPGLFRLDPETAHRVTFALADVLARILPAGHPETTTPTRAMGLDFPNRVGLAAGLDKNAEHLRALARMGFGHIEVGTVTPRAQPGNPRPRLFRLPTARAVINRFGFNNHGLAALLDNVQRARDRGDFHCRLGINLGKNKDTPNDRALDDYVAGIAAAGPHACYLTINISSPNTAALRDLQGADALDALIEGISEARERVCQRIARRVPIALKIAPDLAPHDLVRIADTVETHGIDAIIATNTTLERSAVANIPHANESGGLSGAPLAAPARAIIAALHQHRRTQRARYALIGVGGIDSAAVAIERRTAGADLIQLYTGLIYAGPRLVRETVRALR